MKVLIVYAHPNPMSFTKSISTVSTETRKKYLEIAYLKGKDLKY